MGRDFNVTKAGIHADGLMKDEEIYNIFNTEKLLNRPAKVAVDVHSGVAGIAHWLNGWFRAEKIDRKIDKRDPIILKMKEMVDAEYELGRTTTISDAELLEYFKKASEE